MIDTLMRHSISSNTKNNAQKFSHNSIQGHHHSEFGIFYAADTNQIRWSVSVGCYLDPNSPAARYARGSVLKRPILGCGMLVGGKKSFLIISDAHFPYHHRDMFAHLIALDAYYGFDEILCVGDLIDHHAGSYHESEPDALSPEDEYYAAQECLWELQSLFPKMTITFGNHDQIPERKLKTAGLPSMMVSDYNSLYDLENQWLWLDEYKFDSTGSMPILQPMRLKHNHRWDGRILEL